VEFKGSLFAANIQLQELYEKNTIEVLENLITVIEKMLPDCYDYKLKVSVPVLKNGSIWKIQHKIEAHPNKNLQNLDTLFVNTISSISMTAQEVKNYRSVGKHIVPVRIERGYNSGEIIIFSLRNGEKQLALLWNMLMCKIYDCATVDNGLFTFTVIFRSGFIGGRFSERVIDGETERVCDYGSSVQDDQIIRSHKYVSMAMNYYSFDFGETGRLYSTYDATFDCLYDLSEIKKIQKYTVKSCQMEYTEKMRESVRSAMEETEE
jgi:hypothetical protein